VSGGSFDYLSSRAPDEARSLASQIQRMADALRDDGFPVCAERTARVVAMLRVAADEAVALEDLWHAKEWRDSGDLGRAAVRRWAVALGEPLPPCAHVDKRPCFGWRDGQRSGPSVRFLVCEECGDEFDAPGGAEAGAR
jgi:hypothetical protein